MVLVSPNHPSAFPNPNGLPNPGPRPDPDAVLVRLTSGMATTLPYAITGDAGQWLWLSPGAAEFAVSGKNAVRHEPQPE